MADFTQTGGTNGGTYARYFSGILSVWENSYDVNSNTSNVGYRLQLKSGSSGRFSGLTASYSVTINGVTVKSGSGTYSSQSYNTAQTICEGTVTIGHNDDGTKTIGCSAVLDFQSNTYSPGDFYPSGNLTLSTIPRYANITRLEVKTRTINSITLSYKTDKAAKLYVNLNNGESWLNKGLPFVSNTTQGDLVINYKDRASTQRLDYNTTYRITVLCRAMDSGLDTSKEIYVSTYDIGRITQAPNINIGSSQTLTLTNPMNLNTYLKLYTTSNTLVQDFGQISGNSITITPTANLIYPLTPNNNTITLKYVLTSVYENNNYKASKECTFTVVNSNPTFNDFDYEDTNVTTLALTGNNQIIVKDYSILKGIITTSNKAVGKNSATIKDYKFLVGNQSQIANYQDNQDVEITLQNPVTINSINMYATDSRGNSTGVNKVAQIKEYTPIKILSATATRINNVSTGVVLSFQATFWNDNFGQVTNTITNCIYKYKETSQSTYTIGTTTLTYTINNSTITGEIQIAGDLGASGFNASDSYNIELDIADKLSSATYTITLGNGEPAIAIYKNNVAIGQKYDTSTGEKLQVKGNIKVSGTINGHSLKTACGRDVKTATSKTHSNYGTDNDYLPDMSMIAYWNGAYNSSNSSNLTYAYQGTIQCKPTILYDNSSGTTGTITLNQTIANFTYVEVYYKRSGASTGYNVSAKGYNLNGKNLKLIENSTSTFYHVYLTFSGTSVTRTGETGTNFSSNWVESGNFLVYRIIGYK